MDANSLYQKLIEAGNDWADKKAAFNILDDTRHAVLARLALEAEGSSVAAREIIAKASKEYSMHVEKTQEAMKAALKAQVKYESMKTYIDLKRTEAANLRAEMKL